MKQKWATLLLLFAFSFSVRFALGFRQMAFGQDQARDNYLMREYKREGKVFLALGPKASVGNFYLPPFYYQLQYFLSYSTGFHPLSMQWVIILVESFTPILLFLLVSELTKERTALLAGLIYCFLPLTVTFASFAWNPNMVPFFTTLALFCWVDHWRRGSKWTIVAGVVAAGVAISLHYQAVVVAPFAVAMFLASVIRDRKDLKYWVFGGLLFLMTLVPYLRGEWLSSWANERAIITYFREVHATTFDRVTKPQYVFSFIPAFMERVMLGANLKNFLLGRIVLLVGLLYLVVLCIRDRRLLILLLYFLSILVMLRVYKGDKIDYYMSTLFILPAILTAFLVSPLKRFSVIPVMTLAVITGFLLFLHPPSRDYYIFNLAGSYIQDQTKHQNTLVLFHTPELVNLFAYDFAYAHPISLDTEGQTVVDLCYQSTPCDDRYSAICWSGMQTEISIFKYKYGYHQVSAQYFSDKYEVVIGKVKPHSAFNYFNGVSQFSGSDLLLRDYLF